MQINGGSLIGTLNVITTTGGHLEINSGTVTLAPHSGIVLLLVGTSSC